MSRMVLGPGVQDPGSMIQDPGSGVWGVQKGIVQSLKNNFYRRIAVNIDKH